MVGIVDYGLGNIRSLAGALKRIDAEVTLCKTAKDILSANRLILPGVGAFGDGIKNIHDRGQYDALIEAANSKKTPVLGICLGAQLLGKSSEEFGIHQGLGLLDMHVKQINAHGERLPHVGWNEIEIASPSELLEGVENKSLFYFVHSFCMISNIPVTAYTTYGERFSSVLCQGNIAAFQFHPEKSQLNGIKALNNFLSWSPNA